MACCCDPTLTETTVVSSVANLGLSQSIGHLGGWSELGVRLAGLRGDEKNVQIRFFWGGMNE